MSFRFISTLLVLAFLASAPPPSLSESLSGRVLDPSGRVVAGATLRLFERSTGERRTTTAAADGTYEFASLPVGSYVVQATSAAATLSGSREVTVSGDLELDLELAISATDIEILVTATSTPQSIEEVGKAIDVVSSEEIARRDEASVAEAVRNLPGIRVRTLAGPGSLTSIQTRGLRNADTAVLVDGMRFRDAASIQSDATSFIDNMATTGTERIEFLRGSGSTLYGSNAVGGVIDVASREGSGPPRGEFQVEGGGLGMVRTLAGVGGGLSGDRFTYSLTASHLNLTRGVREGNIYRNTTGKGVAGYKLSPTLSVTGRVWWSDGYSASTEDPAFPAAVMANFPASGEIPAVALPVSQLELYEEGASFDAGNATFVPNQRDPDGRRISSFTTGRVTLLQQKDPGQTYRLDYQGVDTNRKYIDGPAGPGLYEPGLGTTSSLDGRTDTLRARADLEAGPWGLLTLGYELERDRYHSFETNEGPSPPNTFADLDQHSHAVYGQNQLRMLEGRLTVTLGGRMQFFSLEEPGLAGSAFNPYENVQVDTPDAYTGDVSAAYFIPRTQTKLRSHVGNSFRAPSAYERFGGYYFLGDYTAIGDPGLEPERAVAYDAGIDQWLFGSKLRLSGTLFYTSIDEMVAYLSLPADDPWGRFGGYTNSGGGISRGVEFGLQAAPVSGTSIQFAYTYVNSDSRTLQAPPDYYKVLGISDHAFSFTVSQWIARRTNVTFDLFAVSDYAIAPFELGGRRMVFDGPVRGDVAVRYDMPLAGDRTLEWYGKVENVFNRRYYENGFMGPGAWAVAGIRFLY